MLGQGEGMKVGTGGKGSAVLEHQKSITNVIELYN